MHKSGVATRAWDGAVQKLKKCRAITDHLHILQQNQGRTSATVVDGHDADIMAMQEGWSDYFFRIQITPLHSVVPVSLRVEPKAGVDYFESSAERLHRPLRISWGKQCFLPIGGRRVLWPRE